MSRLCGVLVFAVLLQGCFTPEAGDSCAEERLGAVACSYSGGEILRCDAAAESQSWVLQEDCGERSYCDHDTTTCIAATSGVPSSGGACCKRCGSGSKACGDSCIPSGNTCRKGPGCAC